VGSPVRHQQRALLLCLSIWVCSSTASAALPVYRITAIPVPPGQSGPVAINNAGQVTGWIDTPTGSHVFIYSAGVVTDIGQPPQMGPGDAQPVAINASGAIVGNMVDSSNQEWAYGFVYSNGSMTQLPNPSGQPWCEVMAINDPGLIVGNCSRYAEVWANGAVKQIATGDALSVNDYGQIGLTGSIYTNGVLTTIPPLNTSPAPVLAPEPYSINNAGQAVGWEQVTSTGVTLHAFLYRLGVTQPLTQIPNSVSRAPMSINNAGQVVGYSLPVYNGNPVPAPFFLADGALTNINALISPDDPNQPFVTIDEAYAINDSGWIIASGSDSRSQGLGAYLLSPVTPFPPMVQLLASSNSAQVGTTFTLFWVDQSVTSCSASGGGSAGGWSGTMATQGGQAQVQESTSGTYDYALTCMSMAGSVTSSVKVVVSPAPSSGGGDSGMGGGGGSGSFDALVLGALFVLMALRSRHPGRDTLWPKN
jgi:uncharacterized membrane protein